jgi:alpha-L-arabinofuranosidase
MQDIEENILAFEMLPNRPVPEYFWSGIKGAMEAVELPIVEGFASRSNDGSKVFLNVVNRSPRKRAVIRISFINFEDMRPLKAGVIRRNRKQDRNYPDKVNNVTFAEISVRKYRRMDHVNLDIPASGIASMVLTSEP